MSTTNGKNIAVILAGGTGNRMGGRINLPKQFYLLNGKPILVHTLEIFEKHPEIHGICIVCLPEWFDKLSEYVCQYKLSKVKWYAEAGKIRQQSVYNGLLAVEDVCGDDDVAVIHDGVRLFIKPALISANIQTARECGPAMTSIRNSDSLLISRDSHQSNEALERDCVFMVQTPQTYRYRFGLDIYRSAYEKGITSSINCCELFVTMGHPVFLVPGLKTNVKITTAEDIEFLHALHQIYDNTP
jgi:2-C-methyl-D-erythritol 4-phosphate cytidylyltransferase